MENSYQKDNVDVSHIKINIDRISDLDEDLILNIKASKKKFVVLDCIELNDFDSSEIGLLINLYLKTSSYNKILFLINVKGNIKKLLSLCSIDKYIKCY